MSPRTLLLAIAWGALAAPPAAARLRIGVFADPAGTVCSAQLVAGTVDTLYVLAILDDPPLNGLRGTEFRITGFPSVPAVFGSFSSNQAAAFTTGDALTFGTKMPFGTCQTANHRVVELGRITMFVAQQLPPTTVRVEASTNPSNRLFDCPIVLLCDNTDECAAGYPVPKLSAVCVETTDFTINGGSCTVDVGEIDSRARLHAWPNPAGGAVQLFFGVQGSSGVHLQVYDVAGRRVRELLNGRVDSGEHVLAWDGRDDTGRQMAAGVYFVRLSGPAGTTQARVTLLR